MELVLAFKSNTAALLRVCKMLHSVVMPPMVLFSGGILITQQRQHFGPVASS